MHLLIPRPNLRLQPDAPNQLSQLGEDQQHNKLPWPTVGLDETLLWGAPGVQMGLWLLLWGLCSPLCSLTTATQLAERKSAGNHTQ